jgi:hypothetical protein
MAEWNASLNKMACDLAIASITEATSGAKWVVSQSTPSSAELSEQCLTDAGLEVFTQKGASFVTLEKHGRLRGCIGSLIASRPLSADIVANAAAAAVSDPRFPSLQEKEITDVSVSISILSVPADIDCHSEAELVAALEPGKDGLILHYGSRRATYLPSVWEQLPDPAQFVTELKRKAGFDESFWHEEIKCQRYHVHYIKCCSVV